MSYNKVSQENIDYFASFLQESNMIVAGAKLEDYSHDYTEDLRYFPEIVLKPVNTQDVSKIVSYCNENKIPVTPCGARTGLSGGSLPVCGGIAMSMERFTSIWVKSELKYLILFKINFDELQ